MSNVLIGIIGVILFIGLALAGALFLGPRFQEATNNSKASALVQSLSQTANAVNMYRVQEGKPLLASSYTTNVQTMVDAGYLKSAPASPAYPQGMMTVDPTGTGTDVAVDHVYSSTGAATSPAARSICMAVEKQAGATDPEERMTPQQNWGPAIAARKTMGCFLYGNYFYAYVGV